MREIRWKKEELKRFVYLMDGNNRCLPEGRKDWASGSGRDEICGSREKFSAGEGRAERKMRLLGGLAECGQVDSGSTTQRLWLGKQKNRSQVVSED